MSKARSLQAVGTHEGSGASSPRTLFAKIAVGLCLLGVLAPSAMAQSSSSGLNPNQQSMSDAIRNPANPSVSLCPKLSADYQESGTIEYDLRVRCSNIVTSQDPAAKSDALQQVTAEELNAPTTNSIDFSRGQRGNIAGRLVSLRGGMGGGTVASNLAPNALSYASNGGASGDESGRLGLFVNGVYGSGDKSLTDYEAAYNFDRQSVTFGMDYRFSDSFVAGAALGYGNSTSDYKNGGSLDGSGVSGSIFASWYGPKFYVDAIAGYTSSDFDSKRHVVYTVTGAFGEDDIDHTAKGSTSGDTLSAGLSAGYDFGNGPWRFGPAAAVSYVDASVDGFAEKGGTHPELNLLYKNQSAKSLQFQLGFDVAYSASTSWGVVAPYAHAYYVAETENNRDSFKIWYVADPYKIATTGATVTSDKPDDSFFVWTIGLSATFANGFAGFVDYQSVESLQSISYGEATLGLRYEFR